MTERNESPPAADERAERLARLRSRRGGTPDSLPAPQTTTPLTDARPTMVEPVDNETSRSTRRRRPATTAKIVTVGASTTALLGMVAGYGIADRAAASDIAEPPISTAVNPPAPTIAPASSAPNITEPARVVVVVIDATTGTPISAVDAALLDEAGLGETIDRVLDGANELPAATTSAESHEPRTSAPVETPPVSTAPSVVAPASVDLAVPEPPPPAPAPAPATASAPAPAPAPAPQAETSGS